MWDKLGAVFDMENPLMRALSVVADLILLNFLTILGMLPVVTAGASFTARNDVLQHIVVVVRGHAVRADGHVDTALEHLRNGRESAAELQG